MIDQLIATLNIVKWILLIIAPILILGLWWFKKNNKIKSKSRNEENVTYSDFKRIDAMKFVEFDDIVDTPYGGIIVVEKNKKFIALLSSVGSEWSSASRENKANRIASENSRVGTIDRPMEVWQYTKQIDMSSFIKAYKEKRETLVDDIMNTKAEYDELKYLADRSSDEDFEVVYNELKKKRKKMYSLDFRRKNIEEQIAYMERISGNGSKPEQRVVYVVEWEYSSMNFTDVLSEESIWNQAVIQLNNKCNQQISLLEGSSVFAKRMTKAEIIEVVRKQTRPRTADIYNISSIVGSGVYSMVIDSDSYEEEMKAVVKEKEELQRFDEIIDDYNIEKKERHLGLLNNKIIFPLVCENCGKKVNMELTGEQYARLCEYLKGKGLVQEMLYDFSDEERELILSGICASCYGGIEVYE